MGSVGFEGAAEDPRGMDQQLVGHVSLALRKGIWARAQSREAWALGGRWWRMKAPGRDERSAKARTQRMPPTPIPQETLRGRGSGERLGGVRELGDPEHLGAWKEMKLLLEIGPGPLAEPFPSKN